MEQGDKPEGSEESCSTCIAFDDSCTFSQAKRRNADEKYVRHLESEVARLQTLVEQLQAQLEEKTMYPSTCPRTPPVTDVSANVEGNDDGSILEGFRLMTLNDVQHCHYMGQSSYIGIINTAITMKREVTAGGDSQASNVNDDPIMMPRLRPQFWMHISDIVSPAQPYTDFPEPALMGELLNTYYTAVHTTFPLLH
ncbi:hypothetical protein PsYK624_064360 [Phanerochaete sordida]|uniref:BZIP domain-containing protein n=1 Tax=Phanerochaete sordida TaxID=48140 RepID=A0A9P3G6R3_9APHY|nr:hypothetical protein PsYK624_064360 [Phanerochaete sordida]